MRGAIAFCRLQSAVCSLQFAVAEQARIENTQGVKSEGRELGER